MPSRSSAESDEDAELLARIHKLDEVFTLLTPDGGEGGKLNLAKAHQHAHRNFDPEMRGFVSTLLSHLMVACAPAGALTREDFIRHLVKHMISAEKKKNSKAVKEFLGRMKTQQESWDKVHNAMQLQQVQESLQECTFQPIVNQEIPETVYQGCTWEVPKLSAPYNERSRPAKPPKPPPKAPGWVEKLSAPVTRNMPNRQGLGPEAWCPDGGLNARRGPEGGWDPFTNTELQPVTGHRLDAATMSNWVANLRTDEPRPHYGGQTWDRSEYSDRSSQLDEMPAMTPDGRRKYIYHRGKEASQMSEAKPRFKPPKGSAVNNMATSAAGAVPVFKWKDRLRGGYLAAKLDTSPIALETRQRLYECTVRTFDQYEGPPSSYAPPVPYDEYTAVPVAAPRHGLCAR